MSPKRLTIAAVSLVVLGLLITGLSELGESSTPPAALKLTPTQTNARLAGSPPALAAIHAQADAILGGGLKALRARLGALRGRPVVINKWASWCEPCRSEFGVFQRVSVSLGKKVAFLGINSGDTSRADAVAFLRSFPVSYPSYYDRGGQVGEAITGSSFMPATVFYNRRGRRYIHDGPYPSVAKLERDVRLYALGG